MFDCKEPIVYGSSGICSIEGTTVRDFCGSLNEYYILKPLLSDKTTIYAPKEASNGNNNMRNIMSKEEANEIIDNISDYSAEWNFNDIERKAQFRSALKNSDPKTLAATLKAIYIHKTELSKTGKRLHSYDEEIMKNAERLLFSEFSYVFGCNVDEISSIFKSKLI